MSNVSDMVGATLYWATRDGESIDFRATDGRRWVMHHRQDCCEGVHIEDINGDLEDLIDSPIILAEESQPELPALNEYEESWTWTFYRFRTNKGSVDIRWYGSSNGYYGEQVDCDLVAGAS